MKRGRYLQNHLGYCGRNLWAILTISDKNTNEKMPQILLLLDSVTQTATYRKTSNIRGTLIGNKIVDHLDVVGASPVGAAPTTSSFSM